MKILSYPLGQMQANCYMLIKDSNCLVIDPADSADFILEELQRKRLKLAGMIATHGHFDHIMAVGEIQLSYSDIPLHIDTKEEFLVRRLNNTAEHFLGFNPGIIEPKNTSYLPEGNFQIDVFSFKVIKTPGHTPGSSCIYFADEKSIFTGDTLFKDAIGRYDFSYSDKAELRKSLETLFKLPVETVVYPGHGEITLIGEEKRREFIFFN